MLETPWLSTPRTSEVTSTSAASEQSCWGTPILPKMSATV